MKILLIGWNRLGKKKKGNWNHELFRRELARQHDVIFFGSGYKGYCNLKTVPELIYKHKDIDIVLTHYEHRARSLARGLGDVEDVPKVHIMGGDYYEGTYGKYDKHFHEVNYDIIFGRYSRHLENLKKQGIKGKHYMLPWSVDTNKHYKQKANKIFDVMASFQKHKLIHPNRHKIWDILKKMDDVNSWLRRVYFEEYVDFINRSKIFVTCNITDGELSGKYSEVLACGTFLLTTRPTDLEILGYEEGKHLAIYKDDFSDFEDKIRYYLKHEEEREKIAKEGMKMVREKHSSEVRVKEFIEMVEREI